MGAAGEPSPLIGRLGERTACIPGGQRRWEPDASGPSLRCSSEVQAQGLGRKALRAQTDTLNQLLFRLQSQNTPVCTCQPGKND